MVPGNFTYSCLRTALFRIHEFMDEQWEMIFRCPAPYKAEILRSLLEEENIPAVVVNKKDSSYLFGEMEVYVKRDDILRAKQIVERFEANE
jgi:hypothetical protein